MLPRHPTTKSGKRVAPMRKWVARGTSTASLRSDSMTVCRSAPVEPLSCWRRLIAKAAIQTSHRAAQTLRPVTAQETVAAPVADPLDFAIALTPDTAEVRAAVEAELRDLIAREAEPGGTILISHIREAISIAAGETDHVLASPAGNVTAAAGAIVTMGAVTWS